MCILQCCCPTWWFWVGLILHYADLELHFHKWNHSLPILRFGGNKWITTWRSNVTFHWLSEGDTLENTPWKIRVSCTKGKILFKYTFFPIRFCHDHTNLTKTKLQKTFYHKFPKKHNGVLVVQLLEATPRHATNYAPHYFSIPWLATFVFEQRHVSEFWEVSIGFTCFAFSGNEY